MLYFLKHKSYTLLTTMKYLDDITPYGHVKCLWTDNRMEFTSELFNDYLYLIESNTSSQLLILCIKMGPLNSHDKLYFLWQGVSLLSQNCPKTCGFTHWWIQHIKNHYYNKNTRKTPYESFTSSKPNLNKMHIFGMTCFCYAQNKMKLDPRCEKGIFVGYDKSPAYLIYFLERMAIKS